MGTEVILDSMRMWSHPSETHGTDVSSFLSATGAASLLGLTESESLLVLVHFSF